MAIQKSHLRKIIQLFFFALIALIVISHTLEESGVTIPLLSGASLHAVCPFGGVVTIYNLIVAGSFIPKIHGASFVLMIIVFATAILFGPVFCGWICPFGTFQEWIASLGKRLFKNQYGKIIPKRVDGMLRYLRYVVLLWVIIMTATSATLVFSAYDPYYALFNFWTGEVSITGFITLGIVLLLSLVVNRPFCKYACPYGALLGMTNWFRVFPVRRKAATCINCSKCDKACPMDIEVSKGERVNDHQCIACMECTSEAACPIENTVEVTGPKSTSKLSIRVSLIAVMVLVTMFGGIALSSAFGWWSTESSKVPRLIKEGVAAGEYDPTDIRGSYSFGDIEEAFGVPAELLAEAYGFDIALAETIKAKDIENLYLEVGTDSVRYLTALYSGLPFTVTDESILTDRALELLRDAGKLTEEQFAELNSKPLFALPNTKISEIPVEDHVEEVIIAGVLDIKGKHTIADVIEMGVSQELIEQALGQGVKQSDNLRDLCVELGVEFSDVKAEIQRLVDTL